jgi:dTDP-4-amino-4,6-dideoxygalactose transaminase
MDPNRLEEAVRKIRAAPHARGRGDVKAVVPVHLYGQMADMEGILEVARRHGLSVLEDCAQAHGAALAGRKAGTWGAAGAYSFYPTKNLAAFGDGGIIATADRELAERCRRMREYGWNADRVCVDWGLNSRLDELQAGIVRVKLRYLDGENLDRRRIAAVYDQYLDSSQTEKPLTRPHALHALHQYVIRCRVRDQLKERLGQQGIATAIHYPRAMHQHPYFSARLKRFDPLHVTEQAVEQVLSLPMHAHLSPQTAQWVAEAINRIVPAIS